MKSLFFALFLGTNCIAQTNYFVSPTGNNNSSGSDQNPWQNIQYGLNQMVAGDTLNIGTGTFNEKLSLPTNGLYVRNKAGNLPIIDASGITSQISILSILNKNNSTIDGLELKNNIFQDAQGIVIEGSCQNITIKNCKIHDIHFSSNINAPVNTNTNAQGIIVYGTNPTTPISNLVVTNNKLYNCRLGYSEGIAINGNVDGFEVSKNEVYNLTNIGIGIIGHEATCPTPANDQARNGVVKGNRVYYCLSPYATSGGLYSDGARDVVFENNISYRNGYGLEIGCENIGKTSAGIIARNNLLYDNQVAGFALGGFDYPTGSGKVTNASFINNTCFSNDYVFTGFGEMYLSYSENCKIENNIFSVKTFNFVYAELTQPGLIFNYNNVYCAAGQTSIDSYWNGTSYSGFSSFSNATATNQNSISVNPQFVTTTLSNPNLHLQSTSQCINAGNPSFIVSANERDIDDQNRVTGIVDLGADEFYSENVSLQTETIKAFKIYPNPSNGIIQIEPKMDQKDLQIFDELGRPQSFKTGENIDISHLKGIYFLHISFEGNVAVHRFIVL
jgi:Secretion system C-terminal sorting domain